MPSGPIADGNPRQRGGSSFNPDKTMTIPMMRTLSGLMSLGILAIASPRMAPPALAQPVDLAATTCQGAKAEAINAVTQGRNLTLRTQTYDLSNYADRPANRDEDFALIMEGPAAESILNSPRFMTTLATQIMAACSSVGTVTFAYDRSGWFATLGIFADGSIDFFECVEPGPNSTDVLPWGYRYCT